MKKTVLAVAFLVINILTACGGSGSVGEGSKNATINNEATIKLKLSYNSPELTRETCMETEFAQTFKEYLEEKASGRFNIEVYPAAQLGSFSEVLSGVSDGNIETALVNVSTLISNDIQLNVWQIPGSIRSNEECNSFLKDPEMMKTFDKVEETMGIDVATCFTAGARHFTNNKKEIKVPSDMRGIVFRVMENELYVKMVESLNAIAAPMSSSELYSALQNGVVDGQENPTAFIISDLTYEVQKYMTTDGHVYSISPFIVNREWYEALPEELKPIFDEAVQAARESAIRFIEKQEKDGLEFLKSEGMSIYEPSEDELALWHDAFFKGSYDYIVNLIGKENVDNFTQKIEDYRADH